MSKDYDKKKFALESHHVCLNNSSESCKMNFDHSMDTCWFNFDYIKMVGNIIMISLNFCISMKLNPNINWPLPFYYII